MENHQAITGPASQSAARGTATATRDPSPTATSRSRTLATAAAGPIVRQNAVRVVPARFSASAAVSHSSRCLRETRMRQSARAMASTIIHAW